MKKALGYLILSLPFVALAAFGLYIFGPLPTISIFVGSFVAVATIRLGIALVNS